MNKGNTRIPLRTYAVPNKIKQEQLSLLWQNLCVAVLF